MNAPSKYVLLAASLLWMSTAFASISPEVTKAYEHLISENSLFPKDYTPEDQVAARLLKNKPQETQELLISKLSKGGGATKRTAALINILPLESRLQIARAVMSTYQFDDQEAPFSGFLVVNGEREDMQRMTQIIRQKPDSAEAVGLATLVAKDGNRHAKDALLELARTPELGGAWKASQAVQAFLKNEGVEVGPLTQNGASNSASAKSNPNETQRRVLFPAALLGILLIGSAAWWFLRKS